MQKKNAAIATPSVNFQTFSPLCNDIPVEYRGSKSPFLCYRKVGLSVNSPPWQNGRGGQVTGNSCRFRWSMQHLRAVRTKTSSGRSLELRPRGPAPTYLAGRLKTNLPSPLRWRELAEIETSQAQSEACCDYWSGSGWLAAGMRTMDVIRMTV
jgi:hypothetical protein